MPSAPADRLDRVIPDDVRQLCASLRERGHDAWIVGGSVRDVLMGRAPSDWDLATTALPADVRRTFRRTIPTGIAHGTISVMMGAARYEVTTLRGEGAYTDGRHPDAVTFGASIEEDLGRRDFTVNAIAFHPLDRAIVDPFHGVEDIAARVIRAVRDPMERFAEDGLRVLRAARFVASLEFELHPETERAIRPNLATFARVSPERVHDEWMKALGARAPSRAFRVMARTGMLEVSAPLVAGLAPEALERVMRRVDRAPREDAAARLAALVFDHRGARGDVDAWLRGLRFSNREREDTAAVLRAGDAPASVRDVRAARRFVREVGREDARRVVRALGAMAEGDEERAAAEALAALVAGVLEANDPVELKALAITGADVIRVSGRGPGRYVGVVLERLLEAVMDDPARNERAWLEARAREWTSEERA